MPNTRPSFEWDPEKDQINREKHGVSFPLAQLAFLDPDRVILSDEAHSQDESRFYCIGFVAEAVLPVRFTYRDGTIRIFGAGYWRKGKQIYEQENHLHG